MISTETGVGFLIGVAIGAAGQYFADKYTDKRREQDQDRDSVRRFREVAKKMPKLLSEIAADVAGPDAEHIRDLVLLPFKAAIYNSGSQPVFVYYEDDHPNLSGQFAILENNGYVADVTPGNAPTFRASEAFIQHLLSMRRNAS